MKTKGQLAHAKKRSLIQCFNGGILHLQGLSYVHVMPFMLERIVTIKVCNHAALYGIKVCTSVHTVLANSKEKRKKNLLD